MSEQKIKKHFLLKFLLFIIIFAIIFIIITVSSSFFIRRKILRQNRSAIIKNEEIIEYGCKDTLNNIVKNSINFDNLYKNSKVEFFMDDSIVDLQSEFSFDVVQNIVLKVQISTQVLPFFKNYAVYSDTLTLKVVDTKPPVLAGVEDKEIVAGDEIDLNAGITAKDEIDGDLSFTIDGSFDANTPGEYTLTVKTIDKNNLETTKDFKVVVKEKTEEVAQANTSNSSGSNQNNSSSNKNNSSNNNSSKNNSSGNNSSNNNSSSNNNGANNNSTVLDASTKEGRLYLAKQEASRVINQIISPNMSKLDKAKAICYYITDTVSVQSNQSNEAYQTNYGNEAYAALVMKIAACSGRCKAVTLLCDAAGLKSQHINQNQWAHQWNLVQIDDGNWIVIDAQIGFVGDVR